MNSPKNYVIAFFAVATVALAAIAWNQYQELIKLRGLELDTQAQRAAWQKQLWDAQKRSTDLEKKVSALEKEEPPSPETPPREGPRFRGGMRGAFFAAMDNPQIQRLMAIQQKAGLDSRYSALFKSLSLTPEQLDKFKNLLVEKRTAMMDVLSAAREQGINPRTDPEAFQKLVGDAQSSIDDNIRSTLGEAGFNQYQQYEKTLPERNTVDQLAQRLSYTSTPLSDTQTDQMVQLLAANAPTPKTNGVPTPLTGLGAMMGNGGTAHINDADITQAAGVLSAEQINALREIQQEQQIQAQLNTEMRKQFQNRAGGTTTTSGASTAAPPPPPPGG